MNDTKKPYEGFTAEERAAMKDRAKELKAATTKAEDEKNVLAKIAELSEGDRAMAARVHDLIKSNFAELDAKLWYGMPAYSKNGKMIVFFQSGAKFKTRYATLGFSDDAQLDDGNLWPNAYALTELTATEEKAIVTLVRKAVG